MAKVIDITSKLTNERPKLKVSDELEFEIDNRKNTVLAVEKIINAEDINSIEVIDKALEHFIGKDAVKQINELDLSFQGYQVIFTAVMAGALGEDYETVEERFQKEKPV